MSNKKVFAGLLFSMVVMLSVFPTSSMAFWPFSGWVKKGEVKGEQTESTTTKRPSLFQRYIKPSVTPTTAPETEFDENSVSEEKIKEAVKNKKMTEEQRREFLAKLKQIREKRAELKKLMLSLVEWMKTNKIDMKTLMKETRPSTSVSPTKTVTPSVTSYPGSSVTPL